MAQVEYDKWGRMKYNPDYHQKHAKPWTTIDERFLIDNYVAMGAEHVSFALGKTIKAVMQRACDLRKQGKMPPRAAGQKTSKRIAGGKV